ncbi:hypothetical protein OZX74_08920 [Bifidobacterium sp. ESL0798]|uniref:hypothetical protein n=1 Tax=Bifidobacterium sp. ESL0798 TaxID=2983235 RepID=UPI0023F883E1|nr:hypothetical protein [Bifidobacterium sp. ESL0798]WEV73982.1 hypothetical protein OZX74_08920 [Bifidobacterium sp. ESL0798]
MIKSVLMGEIRSIGDVAQGHADTLRRAADGDEVGYGFTAGATNIRAMALAADACAGVASIGSILASAAGSLASGAIDADEGLGQADQASAAAVEGIQ